MKKLICMQVVVRLCQKGKNQPGFFDLYFNFYGGLLRSNFLFKETAAFSDFSPLCRPSCKNMIFHRKIHFVPNHVYK